MRLSFVLAAILLVALVIIAVLATISLPGIPIAIMIPVWALVLTDFILLIYISKH